jgi:hypothetical protein
MVVRSSFSPSSPFIVSFFQQENKVEVFLCVFLMFSLRVSLHLLYFYLLLKIMNHILHHGEKCNHSFAFSREISYYGRIRSYFVIINVHLTIACENCIFVEIDTFSKQFSHPISHFVHPHIPHPISHFFSFSFFYSSLYNNIIATSRT